ncbi:MAG: hypothetical protein ACTSUO_01350 [Candidatus Thorarchaeota archaeon]
MPNYLYIYDCVNARKTNARRVSFTKELYGFNYSWKTKTGIKQKRSPGLLDECVGAHAISDSAILVPDEHKAIFDMLFSNFQDILTLKIFEVIEDFQ